MSSVNINPTALFRANAPEMIHIFTRRSKLLYLLRKRQHFRKKALMCVLTAYAMHCFRNNKVWILPKNDAWWTEIVATMADSVWKNNFRVSKKSYHFLCEKMSFIARCNTNYRKCIPVEKRIAIAVYCLASSAEYRTIANLFGVGKSSVCEIFIEFVTDFVFMCLTDFIDLPNSERDVQLASDSFFATWGFPQCLGAIDGTHIKIQPPKKDSTSYFNYKHFYSVVLLAVVDYAYKFLYICVGSPGRNNDSHVLQMSNLHTYLKERKALWKLAKTINGVDVPICVVGDSAFPLMPTLQKPYIEHENTTDVERQYNSRLSRGRVVVENAFGRLKARFRILRKLENKVENSVKIIQAACILNNVCELFGDTVDQSWLNDSSPIVGDEKISTAGNNLPEAKDVRDSVAAYLFHSNNSI